MSQCNYSYKCIFNIIFMRKEYFYVIHDTPKVGIVTMGLADEVHAGVCEITSYGQMSETAATVLLGKDSKRNVEDYYQLWKGNHLNLSLTKVKITNHTKIDYAKAKDLETGVLTN